MRMPKRDLATRKKLNFLRYTLFYTRVLRSILSTYMYCICNVFYNLFFFNRSTQSLARVSIHSFHQLNRSIEYREIECQRLESVS